MAKSKAELLKEAKELGINAKSSMSVYELTHRIKEKKEDMAKKDAPEKPKSSRRVSGEH